MKNIYWTLLRIIAVATERELARYLKYLKVENETYRSQLPKQVFVTPKERNRLVRFAKNIPAKTLGELVLRHSLNLGWPSRIRA